MLDAVTEIGPVWVICENVPGIISLGQLERVCLDLESIGYETQSFVVPANAVGQSTEGNGSLLLPTIRANDGADCLSERRRNTPCLEAAVKPGRRRSSGLEEHQSREEYRQREAAIGSGGPDGTGKLELSSWSF
jgi:hypothetical protein